jgi:hypothetical protein
MKKFTPKNLITSATVLLVLLVSVAGIITGCGTPHANTGNKTIDSMTIDELGDALVRALDDRATYKTTAEELQAQVDDLIGKSSADNIVASDNKVQYEIVNINSSPIFETGESEGTLMISNSEKNRYSQQVEIYTTADHQLIYSGKIEVGSEVKTSTLLVDLPKGTYDCTAYFRAINPTTGEGVRTANIDIKITIKA